MWLSGIVVVSGWCLSHVGFVWCCCLIDDDDVLSPVDFVSWFCLMMMIMMIMMMMMMMLLLLSHVVVVAVSCCCSGRLLLWFVWLSVLCTASVVCVCTRANSAFLLLMCSLWRRMSCASRKPNCLNAVTSPMWRWHSRWGTPVSGVFVVLARATLGVYPRTYLHEVPSNAFLPWLTLCCGSVCMGEKCDCCMNACEKWIWCTSTCCEC